MMINDVSTIIISYLKSITQIPNFYDQYDINKNIHFKFNASKICVSFTFLKYMIRKLPGMILTGVNVCNLNRLNNMFTLIRAEKLETLILLKCNVEDSLWDELNKCVCLKKLKIEMNKKIHMKNVKLNKLRKFDFRGWKNNAEGFIDVSGFSKLKYLVLEIIDLELEGTKILKDLKCAIILVFFKGCTYIPNLKIYHNKINKSVGANYGGSSLICTKLSDLMINHEDIEVLYIVGINDLVNLKLLKNFKNLKEIRIMDSHGLINIDYLKKLEKLKDVILYNCKDVHNASCLINMKNLKCVYIYNCANVNTVVFEE